MGDVAPTGLTSEAAARRLAEFGPNDPVVRHRLSTVTQLLRLLVNPLVVILLVASAVSGLLGQITDATIIVVMVLLGVGMSFWQSYRSQQAAEALRSMVTTTATVRRDDAWAEIPVAAVVPGDLIRLSAGDLVPADSRLIDARHLSVQQSMLTGESLPVEKAPAPAGTGPVPVQAGPEAPHLLFLGTSVISGTATAVVLTTGPRTVFGEIAARLSVRPPETEFERGLRRFSALILTTTVTLVLFIVLVSIALKHDAFESLLFAVALGVGLTPEFLPMITSVTLTQGALRMAREHVIVKHLPAIQNLGSIDVLCSDKTGTLTAGVMQFDRAVDALGGISARPLTLAYINSHFETGIRSPFDAAILQQDAIDATGYEKIDEIPFDFERRRLSIVATSPGDAGQTRLMITKGAPESVLLASTALEADGRVQPMTDAARAACRAVHERLGADGFRVLAIASRRLDARASYSRDDEAGLVLAGFVSFADPVLPDAADTLTQLKADGVQVKILTGDGDVVARHVCRQVGVGEDAIVTGDDLNRLDDAALGHVAEQASVFTRVSPAQKNRIILALKRRGHVVGFLGDGINDAPSLHAADVGISVMSAADVARQAADIILLKRGLTVLHRGILEGRRASGNMMKYLLMGTSSNFGNMFSMAAASLFLPFLPMLPTQILLNNFLYDLAQITIPTDNVDASYIQRPQRWDMRVVRDFMLFIGPISSIFDFLTFYAMLRIFHASQPLFHTGWFVESLATQTLVLFVIRTMGNPLRSRPSRPLTITTLAIVAIGAVLPATPLAAILGFTRPPARYFVLLVVAVALYLVLVEAAKQQLLKRSLRSLRPAALVLLLLGAAASAAADDGKGGQAARPPATKVTLAYYAFSSGKNGADVNVRHGFKSMTVWVGAYQEDDGFDQVRVGYEYDYRSKWLTLVPSVQAATHDFAGATLYAEAGGRLFAIGGWGRTNLQPYWNLGFDPNDYVQFGAGYRDGAGDVVSVYAIHDNRLDTGQTNTHITVRRYLPDEWRLTVDVVNEHGRGDSGIDLNSWAVSVDADWRRWFVRVAEDPHVNYTPDRQLRVAGGWRF